MKVKANELRNQCLATLELDETSREWLVSWVDSSYEDPQTIADRIEIMELALTKYVSDKLDKANGERP